jgi:hypothetical protein
MLKSLKALAIGAIVSLPFYGQAYATDVNCQFPTADTSQCEWGGSRARPTPTAPLKSTKAHGAHVQDGVIIDHVDSIATDRYTPFKSCVDFNSTAISSFGACTGIDGTKFPSNERHRPVTNSHVIGSKGRLFFGDGTIQDWLDSAND